MSYGFNTHCCFGTDCCINITTSTFSYKVETDGYIGSRFEVLVALTVKSVVLWVVTPCGSAGHLLVLVSCLAYRSQLAYSCETLNCPWTRQHYNSEDFTFQLYNLSFLRLSLAFRWCGGNVSSSIGLRFKIGWIQCPILQNKRYMNVGNNWSSEVCIRSFCQPSSLCYFE